MFRKTFPLIADIIYGISGSGSCGCENFYCIVFVRREIAVCWVLRKICGIAVVLQHSEYCAVVHIVTEDQVAGIFAGTCASEVSEDCAGYEVISVEITPEVIFIVGGLDNGLVHDGSFTQKPPDDVRVVGQEPVEIDLHARVSRVGNGGIGVINLGYVSVVEIGVKIIGFLICEQRFGNLVSGKQESGGAYAYECGMKYFFSFLHNYPFAY